MSSWNCSSVLYGTPPVGQGGMVSGLSHQAAVWVLVVDAVGHFQTEHRGNRQTSHLSLCQSGSRMWNRGLCGLARGLTWKKVTILPTASSPYVDTSHPSEWAVWQCTLVLGEALASTPGKCLPLLEH